MTGTAGGAGAHEAVSPMRAAAIAILLTLLLPAVAGAHPLDRDAYSLRSGLKMGPSGLMAVVILEKPTQFVLDDLRTAPDPWTGKRAGEADGRPA